MSNKLQQRDGVGSSSLEDYEKELVEAEKRAGVLTFEMNEKGEMVPFDMNDPDN